MPLLEKIIENNLPWRIIGRRRKPNREIKSLMNAEYDQILHWNDYQTNIDNPYVESFENKIRLYELRYWDMTFYRQQIKWYKNKSVTNS